MCKKHVQNIIEIIILKPLNSKLLKMKKTIKIMKHLLYARRQ